MYAREVFFFPRRRSLWFLWFFFTFAPRPELRGTYMLVWPLLRRGLSFSFGLSFVFQNPPQNGLVHLIHYRIVLLHVAVCHPHQRNMAEALAYVFEGITQPVVGYRGEAVPRLVVIQPGNSNLGPYFFQADVHGPVQLVLGGVSHMEIQQAFTRPVAVLVEQRA